MSDVIVYTSNEVSGSCDRKCASHVSEDACAGRHDLMGAEGRWTCVHER